MDQAYDQLVGDALLRQEYRRRGITVSDDEILQAARYNPPPQLMQAPDLQTDGQFDPAKYQRFWPVRSRNRTASSSSSSSTIGRRSPRKSSSNQVASDVYISDAQLWRRFQDNA